MDDGEESEMVYKSSHGKGPDIVEKALSAVCYLPMGFFIGIAYILLRGRHSESHYFRFNFYQGTLTQFCIMVLNMGSGLILNTLDSLLNLFAALSPTVVSNVHNGLFWFTQLIMAAVSLFLIYGIIWSFRGKYAEIPYISNAIRHNFR